MKHKKLYIFCLVIFIILSMEFFARIYLEKILQKSPNRKFRFNSYRVYEHTPGFTEGKDGKNWIEINNNGFRRSEDVLQKKPENTFRVFFLGGSAAHGISSAPPYPIRHIYQNETIDAYLEEMLSKKYPDYNIEIINAAVTGYQVFSHTQYILSELLDYDPDLIIFFDGINDHFTNNPKLNNYSDFRYQFWKEKLQNPSIKDLFHYSVMWLSKYSGLARGYFSLLLQKDAVSNRFVSLNKNYKDADDAIAEHKLAAKKQFLRNININLLILKNYNIDSIVCLQPILVLRNKNLLSQQELDFFRESKIFNILYPVVKEEVKLVADKYKVSFIDMVPVFNKKEYSKKQLFIDYCHLSPEGSKLAADALMPELEKIFLKRINN